MTYRNRKLLDLAHTAPCFLRLAENCGHAPSVPCHSDMLRHGRGVGHKSHDWTAIPGCPACHSLFTREHMGRGLYELHWLAAWEKYVAYLWENELIRVNKGN